MKTTFLLAALIISMVLAGCQPSASTGVLTTATSVVPPTAAPAATATPAATDSPGKPVVTSTAVTAAPSTGLPGSSLFEVAWDDRSPFAAGLVTGQQAVLEQQPGASVYHLDVALSDDMTTVHGREEVRFTNTEDVPLDSVVFRLFPNLTGGSIAVSGLTVNGQPVEPIYSLEDSVMTVPLSEPLQPGQQAVLAMDFDVVVPTDPETSNYGTFASFDDVLALAHFYPMIAVYDDEGWNVEIAPPEGDVVYADSGYYLTRITLPDEQVLVASGVTLDESRKDGQQVVTVAAGPARDFYLAASDAYQVVSQQVGETTINSYAPRSLQRGSGEVLDIAAAAMRSYEDHVGPYPYTEMDLVSTATSALGVEYPGIMALTSRIYDGQYQQYLEATVAHEVGHQWFYNVVGDDQLDDPWLDEALTQYITLLYFQDRYGEEGYDGFHQSLESRWDRVNDEAIPVGLPVAAYSEGGEYPGTYGAIVYGRGPLFFEALAQQMGQDEFDAFLRDYYQTFSWNIATTEGLRALAEKHCGCDLEQLFADWVYPK
ncbi:MAG: M1 family metallopeptidase [Anaerolineae bacterium]|nr:M1 family metallopeptidase [Anaerolineae bacterium]